MTQKATHQGVKSHNRRLVLRSVFSGEALNRAALANHTGLTKPTISDIVGELIADGFLEEGGRGESTESGGKRPRLLHFRPDSRQIVGVSIDVHSVYGILADLNGDPIASHRADLNGATGAEALAILQQVINGLIAQQDAPLLCISVGTPGIVYSYSGIVKAAPSLGWYDFPLAEHLSTLYDVPACVGNNTELATRALVIRNSAEEPTRNLVMVLVNSSVEIGIVFGGTMYHHSGDLGLLRVPSAADQLAAYLGWDFVVRRIAELRHLDPKTTLPEQPDYLDIRYGYQRGDWLCTVLYDELAGHLSQIFAWITGIIRPDHIALAGEMVELGNDIIQLATDRAAHWLPPDLVDAVTYSLANDATLSVNGTIAHALERELLGEAS